MCKHHLHNIKNFLCRSIERITLICVMQTKNEKQASWCGAARGKQWGRSGALTSLFWCHRHFSEKWRARYKQKRVCIRPLYLFIRHRRRRRVVQNNTHPYTWIALTAATAPSALASSAARHEKGLFFHTRSSAALLYWKSARALAHISHMDEHCGRCSVASPS